MNRDTEHKEQVTKCYANTENTKMLTCWTAGLALFSWLE